MQLSVLGPNYLISIFTNLLGIVLLARNIVGAGGRVSAGQASEVSVAVSTIKVSYIPYGPPTRDESFKLIDIALQGSEQPNE